MNEKRTWVGILVVLGVWAASLGAQPLAHYTFNDGTIKDVSGNGYDGVLLGTATVADDPERGKVLQVNQSGMRIDGPLNITNSFTLSAWVKLDVPRVGRCYFGGPWKVRTDNEGGTEHHWIGIRYPGDNFLNKIDTRSPGNPQGQLDGQWHHLVVILPENGVFQVYFDGVLAPWRAGATPTRAHDFGGAVGPVFVGTENAAALNAIKGYMDDVRIYNYAVSPEEVPSLQKETEPQLAGDPQPTSGATDVSRDVTLSWTSGKFAAKHNVYLGETFEEVDSANASSPLLLAQGLTVNSLDVGRLEFGKEYFWRVDEVNAPPDSTVFKGNVWSFQVELAGYPIKSIQATASGSSESKNGPERTIDGSGLDDNSGHSRLEADMWLSDGVSPTWIQYEFDRAYKLHEVRVWNHNTSFEDVLGYGFKNVTITHSQDGVDWATLGDFQFTQAPGLEGYDDPYVVSFDGAVARYVRLTANSNWSLLGLPKKGLSEVLFTYLPVHAGKPQPEPGATNVFPAVTLAWQAGRGAASHDLRLGTDPDNLPVVATVVKNSFDATALGLQLDQTYYWRVDEVNQAESPSVWEGAVWNFSTQQVIPVDNMESYRDVEPLEIWATWLDGTEFGTNDPTNGSIVGLDPAAGSYNAAPGRTGGQSLPIWFSNLGVSRSEAIRTFDKPQDWTRFGVTTLVLYFYINPADTTGKLYVKINGTKLAYSEPSGAASPPQWAVWKQWNIPLASVSANLQQVTSLAVGVEGTGATGVVYIDDIALYRVAPPVPTVSTWFEAESGTIMAPMLKYAGDPTASGNMFIGTDENLGDSNANPPADGIASYSFTVPAGTYKVALRVVTGSGSDSFWVRIATATTNTTNHASGWVQFSAMGMTGTDWQWKQVHSATDSNKVVEFTLPAGTHTLEIARRDDGTLLDAIAVLKVN